MLKVSPTKYQRYHIYYHLINTILFVLLKLGSILLTQTLLSYTHNIHNYSILRRNREFKSDGSLIISLNLI